MILFIGDVDRGMRDREGFQEVDFPAMFAPARQMGDADRGCRAASPNMSRAPGTSRSVGRPGPGGDRAARGHAVRRGRGGRPARARAASRRLPDADDLRPDVRDCSRSAEAPDRHRRRRGLGRRHRAATSPRSPSGIGLPVAGAFRRQDAIPNSSPGLGRQSRLRSQSEARRSGSRTPICCSWSARGSARRRPTATR